jgi:hypothetical protein
MNRRQFLAGLGATGLAGCSGSDGSPTGASASPTSTPARVEGASPATGPTASPAPTAATGIPVRSGGFELVGVDAPSEVELDESYTLAFSVRNPSERTRTFSAAVVTDAPGSAAWTDPGSWRETVDPGETVTIESRAFTGRRLGTVHHRLTAFDYRVDVEVVPRSLPFGTGYTTPTGVLLSALGVGFRQSLEYTLSGYVYEESAPAGKTWAFVTVYAENTASSAALLPFKVNFSVLDGASRYPYVRTHDPDGQYNGGRVPPGGVREGWVRFSVPASVEADDLAVAWRDNPYDPGLAVHWEA